MVVVVVVVVGRVEGVAEAGAFYRSGSLKTRKFLLISDWSKVPVLVQSSVSLAIIKIDDAQMPWVW